MPNYEVTKTEKVFVQANDEKHAIEVANDEFGELPDAEYEVQKIAPEHRLNEIAEALKSLGVSAYLDDYRNNLHEFLRVSATHEHPDDDENQFLIQCSLDDEEEFDGKTYALTRDGYEVMEYPANLHPLALAYLFKTAMIADIEARTPKVLATLEDIAMNLSAMGMLARVVDYGRFEGQPKVIEIVTQNENGFTLYQNLTDEETIAGTGYYLMTDEMEEVTSDIGNMTALQVAGLVAYNIGRAEFDMENKGAN